MSENVNIQFANTILNHTHRPLGRFAFLHVRAQNYSKILDPLLDNDKLGIYNEDYSCPLAYRLGSSSDSAFYSFIETPQIVSVVSFDLFGFPDE